MELFSVLCILGVQSWTFGFLLCTSPYYKVEGVIISLKKIAIHEAFVCHTLLMTSMFRSHFFKWKQLVEPIIKVTSHTRLRARDLYLQALSLVEKVEPVQVRFTLRLRDQRSMWMQDGCKVYMDSYMALNGSCFMVTWTIFKTTSWR